MIDRRTHGVASASLMAFPALRSDRHLDRNAASGAVPVHHGFTLPATVRITPSGDPRSIDRSNPIEGRDLVRPVLRQFDATTSTGVPAPQIASSAAG